MTSKLIDSVPVVVWLSMLKVCGIITISKIEWLDFAGTERVTKT